MARYKSGIAVTQRNFTMDLLKEVGMLGCKLEDVPTDANFKLGLSNKENPIDRKIYSG